MRTNRERRARRLLIAFTCVAMSAFSALTYSASADMLTKGHQMNISTSSATFVAGATSIVCQRSEGHGQIGSLFAETTPVYDLVFEGKSSSECETTGMGGVKFKVVTSSHEPPFKLIEKSTSSAQLAFTGGNSSIEYISGACVLKGKADAPLATWSNGTNGFPLATPSVMTFTNKTLNVVQEPAEWEKNCPAALATALIAKNGFSFSAAYSVTDTTQPVSAVLFTPTLNMLPKGNQLKIESSKAGFVAGSTEIVCKRSEAKGIIGDLAAGVSGISDPTFEGAAGGSCETVGMGGAKFTVVTHHAGTSLWRLGATSTTSASLMFTGLNSSIEYISGACVLKGKANIPLATWSNGKNGSPLATPSVLTFTNQSLGVVQEPAEWEKNCPAALAAALIAKNGFSFSATYSVTDVSKPTSAVLFELKS